MKDIFNAEEEFLLKSIIENEKWNTAPEEKTFYNKLEEIKVDSDPEYKELANNLIKKAINHNYKSIKIKIDEYINELEE